MKILASFASIGALLLFSCSSASSLEASSISFEADSVKGIPNGCVFKKTLTAYNSGNYDGSAISFLGKTSPGPPPPALLYEGLGFGFGPAVSTGGIQVFGKMKDNTDLTSLSLYAPKEVEHWITPQEGLYPGYASNTYVGATYYGFTVGIGGTINFAFQIVDNSTIHKPGNNITINFVSLYFQGFGNRQGCVVSSAFPNQLNNTCSSTFNPTEYPIQKSGEKVGYGYKSGCTFTKTLESYQGSTPFTKTTLYLTEAAEKLNQAIGFYSISQEYVGAASGNAFSLFGKLPDNFELVNISKEHPDGYQTIDFVKKVTSWQMNRVQVYPGATFLVASNGGQRQGWTAYVMQVKNTHVSQRGPLDIEVGILNYAATISQTGGYTSDWGYLKKSNCKPSLLFGGCSKEAEKKM